MPLRIAMVAYTHYESDPRVRREAEALAARGDDVAVWALASGEGEAAEAVLNGVRLVKVKIPRYRGGSALAYARSYARFFGVVAAALARAHKAVPIDVVHVHTMPDFMVFTALLPRLSGAKVLLDMHDLMPDLFAVKFGLERDGLAVKGLRAVQMASTVFADGVICVHRNQYELLLRDGVPAWKLGIVMNAADPKLFPPRQKEPRIKEDGTIRLVYHGTILHRYGVDVAVRAFAEARKEEPRLTFTVFGDGDFLDEVKKLASELGLAPPAFELIGKRLPLDEVASRIRDAHIGVVPNRDDQEDSVLPTKLLEYVSIGIPVVATRTRCISRFFDDKQLELVPVGDPSSMARAIVKLARDKDRRRQMIEAAREWEQEYGFETQKRLLLRTIDHLCADKVLAQKRAAQAAVEGVKTGTRSTPPKPEKPAPKKGAPKPNGEEPEDQEEAPGGAQEARGGIG